MIVDITLRVMNASGDQTIEVIVLLPFAVLVVVLIYLFWLGISASVKLDGWKRWMAFSVTVAGLVVLWLAGIIDGLVEACMSMWMKS